MKPPRLGRSLSTDETGMDRLIDHLQEDFVPNNIMSGRQRKKIAARTQTKKYERAPKVVRFSCVGNEIDIQRMNDHVNIMLKPKRFKTLNPTKYSWQIRLYGEVISISRILSHLENDCDVTDNFKSKDANDTVQFTMKDHNDDSKELFIFDFGTVVFWGFSDSEQTEMQDMIQEFVIGKHISQQDFEKSQDSMNYVVSEHVNVASITNEVITLPAGISVKQLLAISFGIAQSSVLAIFENRIDSKVSEWKHIPEILAIKGAFPMTTTQISRMIGEIYVIRHDLNLHTYILDVPDFFWQEDKDDGDFALYKLILRYLEMGSRVEVLNKRLNMLKDLLDIIQQQMENAHTSHLDWIVIWLIVLFCLFEVLSFIIKNYY